MPAERLLAGLALVPTPQTLTALSTHTLAGGAVAAAGWPAGVKVLAGAAAARLVAVGGVAAVRSTRPPDPPAALTVPSPTPPSRAPAAPEVSSPSPVARYGSVVDTTDDAPARNREPAQLPRRGEGTLTIADSADNDPRPEVVSLVHRGDWVTLSGRGYLRVTWQVPFQVRAGGIVPPTWSGPKGELFHVASGGGHRRDDRVPGEPADSSFLGNPRQGRSVLPDGAQQFWVHEFYHLDGEVTLTQRESGGDYNLYVHLVDRQTIIDDLNTAPADNGPIRYGLTRDPGTDACPVPQFLTRDPDPAAARRQSSV